MSGFRKERDSLIRLSLGDYDRQGIVYLVLVQREELVNRLIMAAKDLGMSYSTVEEFGTYYCDRVPYKVPKLYRAFQAEAKSLKDLADLREKAYTFRLPDRYRTQGRIAPSVSPSSERQELLMLNRSSIR